MNHNTKLYELQGSYVNVGVLIFKLLVLLDSNNVPCDEENSPLSIVGLLNQQKFYKNICSLKKYTCVAGKN